MGDTLDTRPSALVHPDLDASGCHVHGLCQTPNINSEGHLGSRVGSARVALGHWGTGARMAGDVTPPTRTPSLLSAEGLGHQFWWPEAGAEALLLRGQT